jgi:very-short-patch-repair endonuclease
LSKGEKARQLRRSATPAERRLWWALRGRRLAGLKFRRQYPVGRYFVDFYCPQHRLAVETDGLTHDDARAQTQDTHRDACLRARGIRVLRFQDDEVMSNFEGVLEMIYFVATGQRLDWDEVLIDEDKG